MALLFKKEPAKTEIFLHFFEFLISYTIHIILIIFFWASKNSIIQPLIAKRSPLDNKYGIQTFLTIKFINRYSITILSSCKSRKTRDLFPTNSIINEMNYCFIISNFSMNYYCVFFFITFYKINIYTLCLFYKFFVCLKRIK